MRRLHRGLVWVAIIILILAGLSAWVWFSLIQSRPRTATRDARTIAWIRNPENHPEWAIQAGERCPQAPFLLPTSGYIGYLWDDSFRPGHRHQGIDIFGGTEPGETPVVAAYDGYLTRLADWKSTVIQRLPEDPLTPGRQIWLYYTHMADPSGNSLIDGDYPPGTREVFVQAGTLLGYQGNFSGTPGLPVGVHLHFSIVLDDGKGSFLNETHIQNTIDPSPYLGINVNTHNHPPDIPICQSKQDGGTP